VLVCRPLTLDPKPLGDLFPMGFGLEQGFDGRLCAANRQADRLVQCGEVFGPARQSQCPQPLLAAERGFGHRGVLIGDLCRNGLFNPLGGCT
jgi:hypothetical protein